MPVIDDRSPAMVAAHGRRLRTLALPAMWAYGRRLFPIATFLAFGAICCGWAIATELHSPIDATVLAILGSVPLSVAFVDAAAALTNASVLPLALRRVVATFIGVGLATASWLVARGSAAAIGPAPWPDIWAVLEWSTVALSQVAIAALSSGRRPTSTSFGPGILLALVWYLVAATPRFHQLLFDPPQHLVRWAGLLIAAFALTAIASLDQAHRLRRGMRL